MNLKKFLAANFTIIAVIIGTAVFAPWVLFAAIYLLSGLFGGYMLLLLLIPMLLAIAAVIVLVSKIFLNHYLNKGQSNWNDTHHGISDISSNSETTISSQDKANEALAESTTKNTEDWANYFQEANPLASIKENNNEESHKNFNQTKGSSTSTIKYVLIILAVLISGILLFNAIDNFIYRNRLNGEYADALERCGAEPLIITEVHNPFGATKTERATYYPYEESYESKKFIKTFDEKVKGYYCDMEEYYEINNIRVRKSL